MKLESLAAVPTLVKITLDDEITIQKYGESLEFYVYDRQDMDTFLKLVSLEGTSNLTTVAEVVKNLIHDESGNKILKDGKMLPPDLMLKIITETVKHLGN